MRSLLAAVALMAAPVAGAVPAQRDWSQVATRAPDGAFVLGNPNAPVKLVEYLSLTCPHCAKMESEAIAPLTAKYIKPGLVSYEVRHALRDAFDFSASLLARCAGPRGFFAVAPAVYADQQHWFDQAAKWSETAPKDLPVEKMLPAVAHGSGLDAFYAAHGLPPARQQACLADSGERKLLTDMANEAWNRPNFPGTPDFLINGTQADSVSNWPELDAKLAAALKKQP